MHITIKIILDLDCSLLLCALVLPHAESLLKSILLIATTIYDVSLLHAITDLVKRKTPNHYLF